MTLIPTLVVITKNYFLSLKKYVKGLASVAFQVEIYKDGKQDIYFYMYNIFILIVSYYNSS